MTHPLYHSQSSARRFGGKPEDYQSLHDWFDETKIAFPVCTHRALRHHSFGLFEAERVFGTFITNSDGIQVPVRLLGEGHIKEDCAGRIPTVAEWLARVPIEPWMNRGYRIQS